MGIRIRVLPEDLVSKIAAGEVVERPSSVVKELVENAIDAGATDVIVDVRGGGRSHIQVIDNGSGMTRDEALLAIERHATSKISTTEDLYAIHTLGFRGEALAAIGGVSNLEIVTRTPDAESAVRVRVEGGLVKAVDSVQAPVGTSMLVRRLFYNTPARQKFMKSAKIEMSHVADLVSRLAMSHDGVAFQLVRGTEMLLRVSAESTGQERIRDILGDDLVDRLYPFAGERGGARVSGFLSSPDLTRSTWSGLYAFVNRRFLRDRAITRAVAEAYRGTVPKGRHPVAVVFLEVPPGDVDVNVHPSKIEVRFPRPKHIAQLIVEAMRATLVKAPWRTRGATPGPYLVDWDPGLETPRQIEAAEQLREQIALERRKETLTTGARDGTIASGRTPPPPPDEERERLESLVALEGEPARAARPARKSPAQRPSEAFGPDVRTVRSPHLEAEMSSVPPAAEPGAGPAGDVASPAADQPPAPYDVPGNGRRTGTQPYRDAPPAPRGEAPGLLPGMANASFSRMRVIGQYANCFILCQDGDDLVIIDQHAAHERVTFEKLRAASSGSEARSQLLLTPAIVEVPRREAELLAGLVEELARLGLEVEPFGGRTFAVKALPVALQEEDPAQLLADLATEMSGDLARRPLQERTDALLATMACHGSIRANRRMAHAEMEELLKLLDGTDYNYACPHGRPLVVRSTRRDIEKLFKRT